VGFDYAGSFVLDFDEGPSAEKVDLRAGKVAVVSGLHFLAGRCAENYGGNRQNA